MLAKDDQLAEPHCYWSKGSGGRNIFYVSDGIAIGAVKRTIQEAWEAWWNNERKPIWSRNLVKVN